MRGTDVDDGRRETAGSVRADFHCVWMALVGRAARANPPGTKASMGAIVLLFSLRGCSNWVQSLAKVRSEVRSER